MQRAIADGELPVLLVVRMHCHAVKRVYSISNLDQNPHNIFFIILSVNQSINIRRKSFITDNAIKCFDRQTDRQSNRETNEDDAVTSLTKRKCSVWTFKRSQRLW